MVCRILPTQPPSRTRPDVHEPCSNPMIESLLIPVIGEAYDATTDAWECGLDGG